MAGKHRVSVPGLAVEILEPDEQDFILLLADQYQSDNPPLPLDEVASKLGISRARVDQIVGILYETQLFYFAPTRPSELEKVIPKARCVSIARKIEAQRAVASAKLPDHVDGYERRARASRLLAGLIIVAKIAGASIALVLGVWGIVALLRGC